MPHDWLLPGATKDSQSITADWRPAQECLIAGVVVKEMQHVLKDGGWLTELFRQDWWEQPLQVDQIFETTLAPGTVSAWHAHEFTEDRLCTIRGMMKVVLFDNRPDSRTRGELNVFRIGEARPALIVVPPQVWHGIQVLGNENASLINIVDRAYNYSAPDHWRVPADCAAIPYRFQPASSRDGLSVTSSTIHPPHVQFAPEMPDHSDADCETAPPIFHEF